MDIYVESMILEETFYPRAVSLFPYEYVETLVKSLQFSYWMLWDLGVVNPSS